MLGGPVATPTAVRPLTFLRVSAIAFLVGWGLHVIDHLRRGMAASPMFIMIGGTVQGVFVVVAITMALRASRGAPEMAIFTGVGSALIFTYAHLLPSVWPNYQDSYLT